MKRSRTKHKKCPYCDGKGVWWTDVDYDTSPDERPCQECNELWYIPRKIWRRRKRHKREMERSIYRWLVRMGRARGTDGMPALIQPHTPTNIEIGGGFCWHPKTKLWPRFGRVTHNSMFANWVKCTECDGSGKAFQGMFGPFNQACTHCTGRGVIAGLSLIMQARSGGVA